MNTEKKEHVVTEVYYPLGRKVPYLRRTGQPLKRSDPEFISWLNTCTHEQYRMFWWSESEEAKSAECYRTLEVGETVKEGDEVRNMIGTWESCSKTSFPDMIGYEIKSANISWLRTTRPKPEQHAPAFDPKQDNQYVQTPEPVYRSLEPDEQPQPGDEVHYGSAWMKSEFIGKLGDELRKRTRTTRPKPTNIAPKTDFYPRPSPCPNFDPKGEEGKKKPQLALIPPVFNTQLANALAFGAYHRKEPYGPWNWRKNKVEYMTYLGAMKRHIDALLEREDVASDSGVHHLGHIAASCAIVLDAAKHGTLVDNRPPGKLNSEPVVDNGAFSGVERKSQEDYEDIGAWDGVK